MQDDLFAPIRQPAKPPKAPGEDRRDYTDEFSPERMAEVERGSGRTLQQLLDIPKGEEFIYLVHNRPMESHVRQMIAQHLPGAQCKVMIVHDQYSLYRLRGRQPKIYADHELVARASRLSWFDELKWLCEGGRLSRHGRPE